MLARHPIAEHRTELLDGRVVLRHGTVELSDHLPLRAGVSPRGGF